MGEWVAEKNPWLVDDSWLFVFSIGLNDIISHEENPLLLANKVKKSIDYFITNLNNGEYKAKNYRIVFSSMVDLNSLA
jgi:hypothetical protein